MQDEHERTMLIPATKIPAYIDQTDFPGDIWEGAKRVPITKEKVLRLCAEGAIIATGSFKKLRRLQAMAPNPRLVNLTHAQRLQLKAMTRAFNLQSEASRTVTREPLTVHWVWKHHAERCSAAQPRMEPVGEGAL